MADNRQSIESGRGHVTLTTNSAPLESGLRAAEKTFKAWGQTVLTIGASITAASAAIMAPFLHGLTVASEWGREAQTAMRETGLTFREFDTLTDGLRIGGEELVPAIAHVSAHLTQAANGGREAIETFDTLGLSIDGLLNASQGERMMQIADGLARIGDAGQRVALQRALFGRSGLALNVTGGRAGIQARADRADVLEGETVNSERSLAQIQAYNAAVREMKMVTQAIWAQLGIFIAPFMSGLVRQITSVLIAIREWMEEHRGLVTVIFYLGAALGILGTAITAIGSIVWVAGGAFGAFASAVGFVWRAVTTLGGALALLQYGSMIVGFGTISTVAFLARAALYSYKLAVAAVTSIQWAYNFALGVYEGIVTGAAMATGALGVATTLVAGSQSYSTGVTIGYTIATKAAAAAAWVYHAALTALTTGFGILSAAQWVASVGAASWAWLISTSFVTEAIKAAGIWALSAAYTALAAIYNFLTVTLWSFSTAEIFAWIWEVALTQGAALLTFALQFLFGTLVLVTGALGALAAVFAGAAVALNLLGVRFGELHESLAWIDTMADAILGFFRDLPGYIAAAWDYLVVSPVVAFVQGAIEAFNWLREKVAQVWEGINDLIGAADSEGLSEYLSVFAYAAVGLAIFVPLLGYALYELADLNALIALIVQSFYELQDALIDIGRAIIDYVLSPFRMIQQLFNDILAPFLYLRDLIVDAFAAALAWVRAQFDTFGAWIAAKIEAIIAPFRALRDRIVGYFREILAWAQNELAGIIIVARLVYTQVVFIYEQLKTKLEEYLESILQIVITLARIFLPLWLQLLIAVIFFRDQVIEAIQEIIDQVKEYLANLLSAIVGLFSGRLLRAIRDVWESIVRIAQDALAGLQEIFADLYEAILKPFEALTDFLRETGNRFRQLAMQLWESVLQTGRTAIASLRVLFSTLGDTISGVWRSFTAGFMDAMGRIVSVAADAGRSIWASISSVFGTLVEDARRVWEGIKRAFNAGEWDLIWQIVKAAALVAWLEIKVLALQAWTDIKHGAFAIFNELGDYLSDAFDDAWLAIRKGWNILVGEMKAAWILFTSEAKAAAFDVAAANPLNSAARRAELEGLARSARETGRVGAGQARQRAGIDNTLLDRQAEDQAFFNEFGVRRPRNEELEAARLAERVAQQTGNADALAAARARLNEILARTANLPDPSQFAGEGFTRRSHEAVYGTFSAQAAFGMLGANFSESPAARQARLMGDQLEEMRRLHGDMARWMRELIRVAGARFS